jgi:hypothetical protein
LDALRAERDTCGVAAQASTENRGGAILRHLGRRRLLLRADRLIGPFELIPVDESNVRVALDA